MSDLSSNLGDFDPSRDLARVPERVRLAMRQNGLEDTYYLSYNILGYDKLTPHTHGPLCTFMDTCPVMRRLIQMPRSTFKTTIATVAFRIRRAMNNTALRTLIVGNTDTNSMKHLGKIKLHLESNKLLHWLYPDKLWEDVSQAPMWSKQSLYLPTTVLHGEPAFDAIGAGGAAVSRHYDEIDADDIIGEAEAYSETEMDHIVEWFTGLESLMVLPVENCLLDMPSTYWRKDDVYAFAENFYGRGKPAIPTGPYSYLKGDLAVFRRGAVEDGKSIFPEGLSLKFLARLNEENPERYAAQYANNPISSALSTFKPEYRRYYDQRSDDGKRISITYEHGEVEIINTERLQKISFCDPHAGGSQKKRFRGTRAAVITTACDEKGRIFILDCFIRRVPTNEIVDEILRQNEKWEPEIFSIEGNGFQKMLKFWIDERVERDTRLSVPYHPYIPKGDKDGDLRIKGLQPLYKAGHIYHGREHLELDEEYLAYPRGKKDGMDALAQGLEFWDTGWDLVESEVMDAYERALRQTRNVATGY